MKKRTAEKWIGNHPHYPHIKKFQKKSIKTISTLSNSNQEDLDEKLSQALCEEDLKHFQNHC
jgi:hypothetical protein